MTYFELCPNNKNNKKEKDAKDFLTCYSQVKILLKIGCKEKEQNHGKNNKLFFLQDVCYKSSFKLLKGSSVRRLPS